MPNPHGVFGKLFVISNRATSPRQPVSRLRAFETLEGRDLLSVSSLPSATMGDTAVAGSAFADTTMLPSPSLAPLAQESLPAWAVARLNRDGGEFRVAYRAHESGVLVFYDKAVGTPEILYKDRLLQREVSLVQLLEDRINQGSSPQGTSGETNSITGISALRVDSGDLGTLTLRGVAEIRDGHGGHQQPFSITILTPSARERNSVAMTPFDRPSREPIPALGQGLSTEASEQRARPFVGPVRPSFVPLDRFSIEFFGGSSLVPDDKVDERAEPDQSPDDPDEDEDELVSPMPASPAYENGQSTKEKASPQGKIEDDDDELFEGEKDGAEGDSLDVDPTQKQDGLAHPLKSGSKAEEEQPSDASQSTTEVDEIQENEKADDRNTQPNVSPAGRRVNPSVSPRGTLDLPTNEQSDGHDGGLGETVPTLDAAARLEGFDASPASATHNGPHSSPNTTASSKFARKVRVASVQRSTEA